MNPLDLPAVFLIVPAALVGLTLAAFWVWMLIDCLTREQTEGHDRLVWALVIVFTKVVGAFVYYFVRYRKRERLQPAESSTG